MENLNWTTIGILSAIIPVMGVPLALLSQYFKSLHEYHVKRGDDLLERINDLAGAVARLSERMREFERHYTTRDDWSREVNLTRTQIDKLTDIVTKLQSEMKNGNGTTKKLLELLEKRGS